MANGVLEQEDEVEQDDAEQYNAAQLTRRQNAIQDDTEVVDEAVAHARENFNEEGEEFDEDAAELVLEQPPQRPPFPLVILLIAIADDALDVIGALVGLGPIITIPLQIVMWLILFMWLWNKLSGRWWKKGITKWLWRRLAVAMGIELIPYVGEIIPANTILILMGHYKETKVAKLYEQLLEELRVAEVAA